jgi:hypothetical protein
MICLMHDGTPYGHLRVGGKVILTANLARIVGATLHDVEGWLQELRDAQVYSKDNHGAIYSRRMIRDEEIRIKRAAGGVKGGNPMLLDAAKHGPQKVNLHANLEITPASSSSSSSAFVPQPHRAGSSEVVIGREILSLEQVKSAVMTTAIPDDFTEMVYSAWTRRSGKDGCSVPVEIVGYVRDRWRAEQVDWRNGTHRGKRHQKGANVGHKNSSGSNRNSGTTNDGKTGGYSAAAARALTGKPVSNPGRPATPAND